MTYFLRTSVVLGVLKRFLTHYYSATSRERRKKMTRKILKLEAGIRKCEKNLVRLEGQEAKARERWTKEYGKFLKATTDLTNLKRFGTIRHEKLKNSIQSWQERSGELTRKRDEIRAAIAEQIGEVTKQEIELSRVVEKEAAERKSRDELVSQIFLLNNSVIAALEIRNHYLSSHVYNQLVDEQGNLRSQLTFIDSDGTKKVVALVNTIQIVLPDLAAEAMREIEQFFDRFRPHAEMDEATQALYDLTKKLLVMKTKFRIGPDLYRFLSLELDKDMFPELRKAQDLLKNSIRSEKTDSYIRLYRRASRADKWEQIKQT